MSEENPTPDVSVPTPKADLALRIEALLFAASKPVTVHELTESLGGDVDHHEVQHAVRKLQHIYASRTTSLEVRRVGEAFALQVRPDYLETAHKVAPLDIPTRTLRVLALVAYHQPIRQSLLVRMIGTAAYDEVSNLRELGYVHAAPRASTLELTTTTKFAETFGLGTAEKGRMKVMLEQRFGIKPTGLPVGEPTEAADPAPAVDTAPESPSPQA